MWKIALRMAQANLREITRDRRAMMMMILMPLLLISILSFALGDLFGGKAVPPFTVSVYNADHGQISSNLVKALKGMKPHITVTEEKSKANALAAVSSGTSSVAVIIPAGLENLAIHNKVVNVQVLASLNNDTKRQIIESIVDSYGKEAGDYRYVYEKTGSLALTNQALKITPIDTGMHPLTSGSYYAIGMMAMFMLSTSASRANRMVEERFSDTYKRLMASPASRFSLTFGYFVSFWIVIAIQGALLLLASRFILGITLGPVYQTALLLICYSATLSGLTLLLGTVMKSPQLMDSVGGIGSQVLAVLGGSIFPIYQFPSVFQAIAKVIPNGQAVTAFDNSVLGTTLMTLMPTMVYLLFLGIGLGLLSGVWFGRPTRAA